MEQFLLDTTNNTVVEVCLAKYVYAQHKQDLACIKQYKTKVKKKDSELSGKGSDMDLGEVCGRGEHYLKFSRTNRKFKIRMASCQLINANMKWQVQNIL